MTKGNNKNMTTNCVIDLSHHNPLDNFLLAKADGVEGIIYKATQGTTWQDSTYKARMKKAKDAGLMWGAYHFGTGRDPVQQAENFLKFVNPDETTLLALDFEENPAGTEMTLEQARIFVEYINTKTGKYPGLYGGHYLKELLGNNADPVLVNCWLWVSQYGSHAVIPPNWNTWTMWQYTDGVHGPQPHSVNGIGKCDRNIFNGDITGLRKLWGYKK